MKGIVLGAKSFDVGERIVEVDKDVCDVIGAFESFGEVEISDEFDFEDTDVVEKCVGIEVE
jgi:hypothetical protein